MWFRLDPCLVLATALLTAAPAMPQAQPSLQFHPLFQDHAVLQRGRKVDVFGTAAAGARVRVRFGDQEVAARADADGRWSVQLAALEVGAPRELVVADDANHRVTCKDVLVGDVWLCSGQSNMVWAMNRTNDAWREIQAADHPRIRLFQVGRLVAKSPAAEPRSGRWQVCSPATVPGFSAVAYFFGRHLQQRLDVPIGLVQSAVGGTPAEAWTSSAGLAAAEFRSIRERWQRMDADFARHQERLREWRQAAARAKQAGKAAPAKPKAPQNPMHPHRPSGLFCGMIAPLTRFAFRGVIWYQGEANVRRAWEYRRLFPAMIQDWRRAFGQPELPFLWVQLAAFRYRNVDKRAGAELWEAQGMALSLPHTGQAVAMDLGNPWDIHPRNKQDVGHRLGLAAEAVAYGRKVQHSGPVFHKLRVDGARAVLEFDQVGNGLVARKAGRTVASGELIGFEVAGEDRKFHPARAVIEGDTVVVTSPQVTKPVAVRYAWHDTAIASLYNQAGLPASAFRTDRWPGVTEPAGQVR